MTAPATTLLRRCVFDCTHPAEWLVETCPGHHAEACPDHKQAVARRNDYYQHPSWVPTYQEIR